MADKKNANYLAQQTAWLEDRRTLTPAAQVAREYITNPRQALQDTADYWSEHHKGMDDKPWYVQAAASLPVNPMWPAVALAQMNNYNKNDDWLGMGATVAGMAFTPFKPVKNLVKGATANLKPQKRFLAASAGEVAYDPKFLQANTEGYSPELIQEP